jgi:hypothetical protein
MRNEIASTRFPSLFRESRRHLNLPKDCGATLNRPTICTEPSDGKSRHYLCCKRPWRRTAEAPKSLSVNCLSHRGRGFPYYMIGRIRREPTRNEKLVTAKCVLLKALMDDNHCGGHMPSLIRSRAHAGIEFAGHSGVVLLSLNCAPDRLIHDVGEMHLRRLRKAR